MRVSHNGVYLIKRFEGLELEAYRDIAGVWTIGYGCTRPEYAYEGNRITEAEAERLLRLDISSREKTVDDVVRPPLNQNQFDALVSFEFNSGGLAGSTALARLNGNPPDHIGAADALTWWNKATVNGVKREVMGLTRRRAAEQELFLTPMREITAEANTAKIKPSGEEKPGPRLRCKTFDRSQLRKMS